MTDYNHDTEACLVRLERDLAEQPNAYITVNREDLLGAVMRLRSELAGDGA